MFRPNDLRRRDLPYEMDVAQRNWTWRSAELGGVGILKKEGKWRFAAVDSNCKCSNGRALKCKVFGCRRQFALISVSYAKFQMVMGLASSPITLKFAYLS